MRYANYAAALALALGMYAVPSHAAVIDLFTFNSAQITGPLTASIAASPTPSSFVNGVSFSLSGVSATFEGNTLTGPVTFFDAGGAGGGGTTFTGPKLFTGPDSAPTFLLGTFGLSGVADLGNGGPQTVTGQLTISQPQPGPVPEPLPLALTATGLLGLAGIMHKRRAELRSAHIHC